MAHHTKPRVQSGRSDILIVMKGKRGGGSLYAECSSFLVNSRRYLFFLNFLKSILQIRVSALGSFVCLRKLNMLCEFSGKRFHFLEYNVIYHMLVIDYNSAYHGKSRNLNHFASFKMKSLQYFCQPVLCRSPNKTVKFARVQVVVVLRSFHGRFTQQAT